MNTLAKPLAFLIIYFFLFSCSKSDDEIPFFEGLLIGKWKNTEAYISAGGSHYWVSVDEGEEIEFFENGTFVSNRFIECSNGNYFADNGKLLLEYQCDEFASQSENSEGFITSNLIFKSGHFLLTPTSGPICAEGCQSKYIKLNNL